MNLPDKKKFSLSLFIKSSLVGASIIIPGISAGTLALIFGIYDTILNAIVKLFSKDYLKSFFTLLWIGSGALVGLIIFLILLTNFIFPSSKATGFVFSLFTGFIIGSIFLIKKMISKNISGKKITIGSFLFLLGIFLIIAIYLFSPHKSELNQIYFSQKQLHNPSFLWSLSIGSFMAGGFMLMPGVSGSAILMSWGLYAPTIFIAKNFIIAPLVIVIISATLGVIIWAGIIHLLLKHARNMTLFFIIGLIVGSTIQLFWESLTILPFNLSGLFLLTLGIIIGFLLSLFLNKFSKIKAG